MSDCVVPEIGFSGTQNQPKNDLKGSENKAFLLFFSYSDDISKVQRAFGVLHFEK